MSENDKIPLPNLEGDATALSSAAARGRSRMDRPRASHPTSKLCSTYR